MKPVAGKGSPRKPCCGKVIVAFGVLHALAMLLAILPRDWGVNSALDPYRQVTGTEQNWRMFDTIPLLADREVTVEVADASGERSTVGPVLPGLGRFELEDRIRYDTLIGRILLTDNHYREPFVESLDRAIADSDELDGAVSFELRIDTSYIRLLKRIEEDGELSLLKTEFIGPFSIGGER